VILQIEFARRAFLPEAFRELPIFQQATNAVAVQIAYVNDIFSYPKEVGAAGSEAEFEQCGAGRLDSSDQNRIQ
jgi:hypothetical protein